MCVCVHTKNASSYGRHSWVGHSSKMKIINRNETFLVLCTYYGLKAVEMQDLIVALRWGHFMGKVPFERLPSLLVW